MEKYARCYLSTLHATFEEWIFVNNRHSVANFQKDPSTAKGDTKIPVYLNGTTLHDPDPPDKHGHSKSVIGSVSNNKEAESDTPKVVTVADSKNCNAEISNSSLGK